MSYVLQKRMILLNETLQEETKNKLEKEEENKNLVSGNKDITKGQGKAFIRAD